MKILALFAAAFAGVFAAARKSRPVDLGSVGGDGGFQVPSIDTSNDGQTNVPFVSAVDALTPDAPPVAVLKDTIASAQAIVFGTKYDALIVSSANQYSISPRTLYKLLYAESHFRDDIINGTVRSSTGALGIAQFMPATAIQELGSVNAALDPSRAIPGSARYLAKLIRVAGSEAGGVAAYNWGIGNVQRKGLVKAPQETVKYVSNILGIDITQA
jgi:soluble lytic murein transglycosylase-like protein